jgi:glucose/mannose-6-phosphate isomerase
VSFPLSLDDRGAIERVDAHAVQRVLAAFPEQCRAALRLRPAPALHVRRPRVVIIAAMGGSAASGDLLAACAADRLEVPVIVHRDYGLPAVAATGALVIASSYSGETVEVLSAATTAQARGLATVAVTTGGALARLADRHGFPRVTLPTGLMPRMALGYLVLPALSVLADVGLPVTTESEVAEALEVVDELSRELAPECPTSRNEAKRLALALAEGTPAIYGGPATGVVAYRWKTDLAENAKVLASAGRLPEMNHNEIEAWRGPRARDWHAVLLRDQHEAAEIARRFAVLRELIEPTAGGVVEVWTRGKEPLTRLLSLAYVGQWTSYYLAVLHGVDPWPIPLLDALKERLRP